MNKDVFRLLMRGLGRRSREAAGTFAAVAAACFFTACVLLFQENMYQWQVAGNYKNFGNWFVMERGDTPSKTLSESNYLDEPVYAGSYAGIYNVNWDSTRGCIGYMTEEFMEQANIELDKGRLPENKNEIACDWATLAKLGYNGKLGQEITIEYYYNDIKSGDDPEREAVYTLCGVFRDYTDIWEYGKYIPGGVITEEACEELEAKETKVWIYGLKGGKKSLDNRGIYEELQDGVTKKIYFNASVYEFEAWGPKNIYNYIFTLVMSIGICVMLYQIIGYQHTRNDFYDRIGKLGASKNNLHKMRLFENSVILALAGASGIMAALVLGRVTGWILEVYKEEKFYTLTPEIVIKSILTVVLGAVLSEFVILYMTYSEKRAPYRQKIKKKQVR